MITHACLPDLAATHWAKYSRIAVETIAFDMTCFLRVCRPKNDDTKYNTKMNRPNVW